jgi:hypothetical protein
LEVPRSGILAAATAAIVAIGLGGCRGRGAETPPDAAAESAAGSSAGAEATAAATPPPGLTAPAWEAYVAARKAIYDSNLVEGQVRLKEAIAAQSDFTEAWYNLGATTSRLAIEAAGAGRDAEALMLFRESVTQKRRAGDLIAEGKWFVYLKQDEQAGVVSDLQHALEDADAVLADEDSLLAALRIWAARR